MDLLESLSTRFLDRVTPRLGAFAKPNSTFYSSAVVSDSIAFIRHTMCSGGMLLPQGEEFVSGAAAYITLLLRDSYLRRGIDASCDGEWTDTDRHLVVMASRARNGVEEAYGHDVWSDMNQALLTPPQTFPSIAGSVYVMTSLSLPTPEYLYLCGAYLLLSPFAVGSWPQGEGLGLDEDFSAARSVLIDDLHRDIGVPLDDRPLRQLSHWVVFPFYGWHMNDGQAYNLMTLVDQIAGKKILPLPEAIAYLRRMLTCQCFQLRNLAARTLLIFGERPQSPFETTIFSLALRASDYQQALGPMAKFRSLLQGVKREPDAEALTEAHKVFQSAVRSGPSYPCYENPIFEDSGYQRFGAAPPADHQGRLALATDLIARHPKNWFAKVAFASALLDTDRENEGVNLLTSLVGPEADEPVAHLTLSSHYVARELFDRADSLYLDAVKRWPVDARLSSNALWSLTRSFVQTGAQQAVDTDRHP